MRREKKVCRGAPARCMADAEEQANGGAKGSRTQKSRLTLRLNISATRTKRWGTSSTCRDDVTASRYLIISLLPDPENKKMQGGSIYSLSPFGYCL